MRNTHRMSSSWRRVIWVLGLGCLLVLLFWAAADLAGADDGVIDLSVKVSSYKLSNGWYVTTWADEDMGLFYTAVQTEAGAVPGLDSIPLPVTSWGLPITTPPLKGQ